MDFSPASPKEPRPDAKPGSRFGAWAQTLDAVRSRLTGKQVYAREAMWVFFGQGLAGIGSIYAVRLLSRAMTPAEYGEFNLALTGTMLLHLFTTGPIGQAATRYFGQANESRNLRSYLSALVRLTGGAGVLILAITGLILAGLLLFHQVAYVNVILWVLAYSALYGAITVIDAVQSGDRRRAISAVHQAAAQWSRPYFALTLFAVFAATSVMALAGFAAASLLVLVSQLFFLRRSLSARLEEGLPSSAQQTRVYRDRLLLYAWPFASYGILSWAQLASDRWLLDLFRGPESVAAYAVSYQLGYQTMNLFTAGVSAFLSPILFQIAGDGDDPVRVSRAIRLNWIHVQCLLALTLVGGLTAMVFKDFIFRVLAAPPYAGYAAALPVMIAAGGLYACGQALTMMFFLGADSGAIVGPKVVASIFGILFNYLGARYFGVAGAVGATFAFSALYAGLVALQVRSWQKHRALRQSRHGQSIVGPN